MNKEVTPYEAKLQRIQGPQRDLVHLNVGGQRLTTTISTLRQVKGSFLASMFSGRWEDRLKRDKDGAVFFDFNPQYFILILDYLRARKIVSPDHPAPLPTVPKDQLKTFTSLVEYLDLRFLLGEKFNSHSTKIALQENGKAALHFGTDELPEYVLGENVYNEGIANLKLKLESVKDITWMFVGMVKDDAVTSDPEANSFKWPGSYGWALGSDFYAGVWKNGKWTANNTLAGLCKQGDTIELVLDYEGGKLSLHLPTGHEFHIEIPKSRSWRLNVSLIDPKDKIRIMES